LFVNEFDWFSSADSVSIIPPTLRTGSVELSAGGFFQLAFQLSERHTSAMSARFEQAELLKKQYTDKFVVVKSGVPELKRFQGLTGVVKTVNMSCRALVMFDGPADIGWYDIDPAYLTLVDAPAPKKVEAKAEKAAPVEKAAAPAAKAPAGEKKLSPLEMIRQQGSKTAGASSAPSAAVPPASAPAPVGKKLSPLEMIRQQAALKAAGGAAPVAESTSAPVAETAAAPVATEAAPAPAEAPKPAAPEVVAGKKLSPIEQIRMQAAARANK
jgi:hypothetical protein